MKNSKHGTVILRKRENHMGQYMICPQKSCGVLCFCCPTGLPRFKEWRHRLYLSIEKRQGRRACGTKDTLVASFGKCNLSYLPYDSAISLPGVYPREMKSTQKDLYRNIHSGITHNISIQFKCPSTGKWIKKSRYIHTVEWNSDKKKKKDGLLIHTITWMS